MDNELYHYGVKGMKWGVRKKNDSPKKQSTTNDKPKRHLGIDDRGNISLIKDKTSDKAKKLFAIKTAMWIGSMALTSYVATHPKVIEDGQKAVSSLLRKPEKVEEAVSTDSGIYSKSLGRNLTVTEAFDLGFDLSD